jgi:hypothetical protein
LFCVFLRVEAVQSEKRRAWSNPPPPPKICLVV